MEIARRQAALFEDDEKRQKPRPTGRDEMNLAEFPLSVLSDRIPEGKKSLVFEDKIWDKGTRQWVERRLTITGTEEGGLPTFKDDEVLTAMIQCSAENGFSSKTVPYRQADIIRHLGWRDEGWSYRRVKEALERWVSVTLEYKNAWWNPDEQSWMDERFHIISNLTTVSRDDGTKQNAFVWNDIIWKSLQQGYVKSLDLDILQSLYRPTSKRLYRLLDKRFYKDSVQKFDLAKLGYGKLGLSKSGGVSKLKQKLSEPIRELEEIGFLKPASKEECFRSISKGRWEVIFEKVRGQELVTSEPMTKLETRLRELEMDRKTITRIVLDYPEELLSHKLDILSHLQGLGNERSPKNPVGYLIASLKEGYQDPNDFEVKSPNPLFSVDRTEATEKLQEWAASRFEESRRNPNVEAETPFQTWEELLSVWQQALEIVAVSKAMKTTWLEPLVPMDQKAGILEVAAPTEFVKSYVDRFSPQIQNAWKGLGYPLKTMIFETY